VGGRILGWGSLDDLHGHAGFAVDGAVSESFLNGKVVLHRGDCLEILPTLEECSIDSVVTDPPYHLTNNTGSRSPLPGQYTPIGKPKQPKGGFMGKQWDGGDIAFRPELWAEVFRVLKPGAHLLAFSGTRTYHRMACAIEDAGFEIRDQIQWVYGSGFPKSHNVGDGWGSALKPANEPIVLARKPLSESSIAANVLKHGTGAINVDSCRIGTGEPRQSMTGGMGRKASPVYGQFARDEVQDIVTTQGRWPANLIHDGSEEVLERFPESNSSEPREPSGSRQRQSGFHMTDGSGGFGDSGSAARFFYTAKADADDRLGSKHPTVKPLDLIQYLTRLITPAGGTVLDCFAGTGTTGEAAWREGFQAVLIEREPEYQSDIVKRMGLCLSGPDERRAASVKQVGVDDTPLFGGIV
jgi:site-specific DNA-methyltransferase (adenine-specific)